MRDSYALQCLSRALVDGTRRLRRSWGRLSAAAGLATCGRCGDIQSRMKPAGARETAGGFLLLKTDVKPQKWIHVKETKHCPVSNPSWQSFAAVLAIAL